jgi:hypothetical protein
MSQDAVTIRALAVDDHPLLRVIGGKVVVWSEAGAGTEVELSIPARAVYASAAARSWWSRVFASKTRARVDGDGP